MRALLRLLALLVNARQRRDWIAEWIGEAAYVRQQHGKVAELRFLLGAFPDAAMLLWSSEATYARSPRFLLVALCAVAILVTLASPAGHLSSLANSPRPHAGLLAYGVVLALLFRSEFARFPSHAGGRLFLAAKYVLAVWIVFCGLPCLTPRSAPGLRPHGWLIGYALALTWAHNDQGRRCPSCLRRLAFPVRIGNASQVFLAWYGTESVCDRGHGLMYVSDVQSSCSEPRRWLRLDPTWAELFGSYTRSRV